MGLRLKFNLAIVPLVATTTMVMVWADYRHEVATTMASHALHSTVVSAAVPTGPVEPSTLPEVVARRALYLHLAYGGVLLMLIVTGTNAALHILVFRPLERMRAQLIRMERGHWRGSIGPTPDDEMGRLLRSFESLGPEIGALVGQSLQAERLAVLALLSQRLRGQLEPDVQRVAEIAAKLNGEPEAEMGAAGQELARRAASMFVTVRSLDRAFPQDARSGARG